MYDEMAVLVRDDLLRIDNIDIIPPLLKIKFTILPVDNQFPVLKVENRPLFVIEGKTVDIGLDFVSLTDTDTKEIDLKLG